VCPGVALVEVGGQWALIVEPGHTSDVLVTFTTAPRRDPLTAMADNAIDALAASGGSDSVFGWAAEADDAMQPIHTLGLETSAWLIDAVVEAGWDRTNDGYAHQWLYHQAGMLVDTVHTGTNGEQ
jgi:hypothetical protein